MTTQDILKTAYLGRIKYIGATGLWHIAYDPPPIPTKAHDYQFHHEEYDGPEDRRSGSSRTIEGCIELIKDIEEGILERERAES